MFPFRVPSVTAAQSRHLSHGLLPAILPAQQENASKLLSGGRGHAGATQHSGSSLLHTPIIFTMMRPDPPTSKCGSHRSRAIAFNKHEVHMIFSIHEEITPRICKFATANFAAAQKPTQAAEPTQELGQLSEVAPIQLSLKLCTLTQIRAREQQALHWGCGCISSVAWSQMIHQSPNSGWNSGLQIEKEGYKTTPSHQCTLLKPVWPNLVYKLRISLHNIWESHLGVSFWKFISFWKHDILKAECLKCMSHSFSLLLL